MKADLRSASMIAFITGLISFLWLIGLFFLGLHTPNSHGAYKGLFNLVILAVGIYLAIRQSSLRQPSPSFKQGLVTGLWVTLLVSVMTFLGRYLYFAIINKEFGFALASSPGLFGTERTSPFWLALFSVVIMSAGGILFSLIAAKLVQVNSDHQGPKGSKTNDN